MRYAIYYTPSKRHALAQAAMTWLGRDVFEDKPVKTYHGLDDCVSSPRKYGFHGTLKAPFHLADGYAEADLIAQFKTFASNQEIFTLENMVLSRLGLFFALVPGMKSEALQRLCDETVRQFEPFRAPLSEADIARRKPETLTRAQRDYLTKWGYPFIFGAFKFHLTLTGQVPEDNAPHVEHALQTHFAEFIDQPLMIDTLGLFVEPEAGADFKVLATATLG